jgi:site-specific DNA-methyltransferase (adenine-specific)
LTPYYQDNAVTIYHGDCREILPQLEPVDLVLTDPPYGFGLTDGSRTAHRYGLNRTTWNTDSCDVTFLLNLGKERIIWGANYLGLPPWKCVLVWHKPHVAHLLTRAACEIAYSSYDRPAQFISIRYDENPMHPTQKPLELMFWCLSFANAQTILDPFMGSGTTLRAAKDLGRKAIGIEIEEKYCEIAARRMAQEVFSLTPGVNSY